MEDFLFTDPMNHTQVDGLYDYAVANCRSIKVLGAELDWEPMVGSLFIDMDNLRFYISPYFPMFLNGDYEGKDPSVHQMEINDEEGGVRAIEFTFDGRNLKASEFWEAYAIKCSQVIRSAVLERTI